MYVCICNGITDRAIAAAVDEGARTPEHAVDSEPSGVWKRRWRPAARLQESGD